MSKAKQNAEIDINTVDPDLLKIAKQLAKQMNNNSNVRTKNDKMTCPAAVKSSTKAGTNEKITGGANVYRLKNNNKDEYYSACTRTIFEGKKLCFKHDKAYSSDKNKIHFFEDIVSNNDAYKMTKKDLLEVKKTSLKKENTTNNPNPIIAVSLTKALRDLMESFVNPNSDKESKSKVDSESEKESEKESDKESDNESDKESDNESDKESKSKVDSESINQSEMKKDSDEDSDKEEDSDDEATTVELLTKDGRKLYLDQSDDAVYDLDEDGEGVNIGELMPCNDSSAPIYLDSLKTDCIVGKVLIHNDNEFIRCVLSNKLYEKSGKSLTIVGHVNITKNGMKAILDKKKK